MILAFPILCLSFTSSKYVSNWQFTLLRDYGFDKNGYFGFKLKSNNSFRAAVFLLPVEQFKTLDFSQSSTKLCERNMTMLKNIAFKYYYQIFPHSKTHEFTGTVGNPGVYKAVVANCEKNSFNLTYYYRNKRTFLDSREKYFPSFYIILSFVSTTVVVAWLINAIRFHRFHVKLHSLFMLSAALVAISYYLKAKKWIALTVVDNIANSKLYYLSIFVEIQAISFIFTVNAIAAYGYGILYDSQSSISTFGSIANIFIRIFALCQFECIIKGLLISTNSLFYFSLYFLTTYYGLVYFGYINEGFQIAYYIMNDLDESNTHAIQKCELIMKFTYDFSLLLIAIFITDLYNIIMELYWTTFMVLREIFLIIVMYIDIHYFFYRNGYEGSMEPIEDQPETESTLMLINDPNKTEYAFASQTIV
ncbi:hypothetical protein TRFO_16137 [Tritrichomonas foetus]|uniref:Intimal thickness related receptor IRP domain-containing protein n=1 Tax=Tritrichomonas foetus TaxID=1144522 RepID=A0A1J4KVH5_9EUKA|nr:hypothetical protein TRFO_16137 [Tritrichomonas foetus]|eukprot:OHT13694.1 hypothetical protein TRFO_16137 [Tritrichomonas foetus]